MVGNAREKQDDGSLSFTAHFYNKDQGAQGVSFYFVVTQS